MRLDLFLPLLRKPKTGQPSRLRPLTRLASGFCRQPGFLSRRRRSGAWSAACCAGSGRRGSVRRSGGSCRHFVSCSFCGFSFTFAIPIPPGRHRFGLVGSRSRSPPTTRIVLVCDEPADPLPKVGQTIFSESGPVVVVRSAAKKFDVRPAEGFPAENLEELRFDLGGPWTLCREAGRRVAVALHRQPREQGADPRREHA